MRILLTAVFVLSWTVVSFCQSITLKEKISIQLKNVTAAQVIQELDKQSAYSFSYTRDQLEKIKIASFSYENITLARALELLQPLGLEFNLLGNTIAVKAVAPAPAAPAPNPGTKPGKLTGVIRNEKNDLVPGVSVTVEATQKGTSTSVNGDYVMTLTPGTYTVLFSFVGYQSRRITEVIIKEGEITDLGVVLTSTDSKQMEAVVITSGARRESTRSLLMTQKNSAGMINGISAEQIRVTPDNNAGQVLKRVSGITVQNDKFVTVRGVSDRYNNVLINGATLPSTEPNRRNFSFDIVPSNLIDNVIINKTATPDLPSEFTGGLIQINTKDVPVENFLNVTIGTGFNTASTGRDFINFKRDDKAYLGIVDKNRKWFGDGRAFDQQQYVTYNGNRDTAAMRKVGAQIPVRWQNYRYAYTPQQNYQLVGGVTKKLRNASVIGATAAVTYLNEQFYEAGESRSLQNYDLNNERYKFNTTIGGLLNVAFKAKNHKLAFKNLYNYRYSDQYDENYGYQFSYTGIETRKSEITLANRMLHSRLEGEHNLLDAHLKVDWYGDYISYRREQPDGRFLVGQEQDSGKYLFRYDFAEPRLSFGGLYSAVLDEKRRNAGTNITLPFNIAGEKQSFKMGYAFSKREADYDATGLRILAAARNEYAAERQGLPYYEIVTTDAIRNGSLVYIPSYIRSETTGDRYTATQELQATYGMLDLKLLEKLRVIGGMRFENNKMTVSTVFYDVLTGYSVFKDSSYSEKDWLPSVNLIYSITDKFNIRGAYSKTLARPDFVERSPYVYYDFIEQVQVTGQTALEVSRIQNYDLRFEYYPSGNEIISASVFYKDFDKPVERFYNLGNPSNSVEYKNLYAASAKGFEIDFRKSFSFIDPASTVLRNLFISGNYTWLQGEISYLVTKSPITQKDTSYVADGKRPIQGLSPFIINGAINYQTKSWGFNIAYNRFGRRIVNGGTDDRLIQYENPRAIVDIQLSRKIMKQKGEIKLNISDLLNQYIVIYSNNKNKNDNGTINPGLASNNDPKGDDYNEAYDFVNYKAKKGTNFSLTLNYRF